MISLVRCFREVVDRRRIQPERPGDQPVLDVGDEVVDLVAQLRRLLRGADHDQGEHAAEDDDRHQNRRQRGRPTGHSPPAQEGEERVQEGRDEEGHQEGDDDQAQMKEHPKGEVADRPDGQQTPGVIARETERPPGIGGRRRPPVLSGSRRAGPSRAGHRRRHTLQPARPGPTPGDGPGPAGARPPDRPLCDSVRMCRAGRPPIRTPRTGCSEPGRPGSTTRRRFGGGAEAGRAGQAGAWSVPGSRRRRPRPPGSRDGIGERLRPWPRPRKPRPPCLWPPGIRTTGRAINQYVDRPPPALATIGPAITAGLRASSATHQLGIVTRKGSTATAAVASRYVLPAGIGAWTVDTTLDLSSDPGGGWSSGPRRPSIRPCRPAAGWRSKRRWAPRAADPRRRRRLPDHRGADGHRRP